MYNYKLYRDVQLFVLKKLQTHFLVVPVISDGEAGMENYGNYTNYEDDEIDLGLMFKFIWKKAIWIIVIGVIGALIGISFVGLKNKSLANDTYQSKASIYFQFNLDGIDINQVTGIQSNLMNDYNAFATTRPVVENAIKRQHLDMTYEEVKNELTTNIAAAHILEITATDEDPKTAQKIAQGIADATMECVLMISSDAIPLPLEEANLPTEPITEQGKSRIKFALIGLIAGLFAGCVIFAIIYICSDKILTDDDIKRFLHLNTVAVIKKGENADDVISKIEAGEKLITLEPEKNKEILDEYLEAKQIAKEGSAVLLVITAGSHAKQLAKSMEKLVTAGCKIYAAVLKEQ